MSLGYLWVEIVKTFARRKKTTAPQATSTLKLYTDAAASKGYGAIFEKHKFSRAFSYYSRGPYLGDHHGKQMRFTFTDNAALVDVINKQTSKRKQVMIFIRDLVLSCLKYREIPKISPSLYKPLQI